MLCFQELFYGPYFCQVQDPEYFSYTESIPGPTTELMQELARETHMVLVVPIYESGTRRRLLQHGRRHRRGWHVPRQVPQAPYSPGQGLLGEVLLSPRQPWLSDLPDGRWTDRRLYLLRPTLSRRAGARSDLRARRSSSIPRRRVGDFRRTSGTSSSRPRRWRMSTSSARSTGSASRSSATTTSTGRRTSSTPRGQLIGEAASDSDRRGDRARPRHERAHRGATHLGLLPRPSARQLRRSCRALVAWPKKGVAHEDADQWRNGGQRERAL